MLIPLSKIFNTYLKDIKINGVLHIGAHDCEELSSYEIEGIDRNNIIWIDAMQEKVEQATVQNIPNVYQAVISDKVENVEFKITNNIQSSSILELEEHKNEHPWIYVESTRNLQTTTLKDFFKEHNLDYKKYNFWNLDIQGAELLALKGAGDFLKHVDVIYTEVNEKYLYKNCCLMNEIDDYLKKFRFERVETFMSKYGWGDAVYIRKKGYVTPNMFGGIAGLGNVLFTIASAFAYAKKNNRELVFLENKIYPNRHSLNDILYSRLFPNVTIMVNWYYCQSPLYFKDCESEIRNIKQYLLNPNFELNYDNLAFLQIRRTDYLHEVNKSFNTDKNNYYQKSVKDLVSKYPNVQIVILSDDLEWSNSNIPEIVGKEYNWVFLPRQTTATETLYIMSNCKIGGISANRTLGWWGCWLTKNREVYMPVPWFIGSSTEMELYYEGVNKIHI